jgi:hypothetical protein
LDVKRGKMKKIFKLARGYLAENFGNLVSAGDIYFDKEKDTWNVKILSKTPSGVLTLGEIKFDPEGNIVDAPTKEILLKILKAKLKKDRVIVNISAKDLPKVERVAKNVQVV